MLTFLTAWFFSFLVYLLLTIGSGDVWGLWAPAEIRFGLLCAVLVALISFRHFPKDAKGRAFSPVRWLRMVGYVGGPFFVELAKANWDVAKRVITNDIRPGIVKVKTGMPSDAALTLLANSITLTPGTLTVEVDADTNELFVHMIQVPDGVEGKESITAEELFSASDCPGWIRRITK